MTEAFAHEYAPKVRVNAIMPGSFRTDIAKSWDPAKEAPTPAALVAHARMVVESLAAAEKLAADGISAEVIDLRTISPWDRETVSASVEKTGRAVVVHEAVREFGVGAEIGVEIAESFFGKLKSPVKRLGGVFAPVPFSKPLESAYAPNGDGIASTVKSLFN